jgi:oxidase EvaA
MYQTLPSPLESNSNEDEVARRFTASAASDGAFPDDEDCIAWLDAHRKANMYRVERVPLEQVDGWHFASDTGNLAHRSGRFFTIEGLRVHLSPNRVPSWHQPIIVQREIGILGILVKEFDGVLHCLMQAKMEPGNKNLVQLSPTVQATRSNYQRVHQGNPTPYLDYFIAPRRSRVLVDTLQSEQASWYLHKRNRNIVVETDDDVPLRPGFRWLTLKQIHELLRLDDVVNMDARTVLSIMRFAPPTQEARPSAAPEPGFRDALVRSLDPQAATMHTMTDAISWLTENKARYQLTQRLIPLLDTAGWHRTDGRIAHETEEFFSIVGADIRAQNREVSSWMQPLLLPAAPGLLTFLARRIDGVLHLLVQARPAAGALDIIEAAPTVHCTPHNYRHLAADDRPQYLDYVTGAQSHQIRYDAHLSEEGGRFLHALNHYQIIEADDGFPLEQTPDFIWLSTHQLMTLQRFGYHLNVEARTLLACLHTLW